MYYGLSFAFLWFVCWARVRFTDCIYYFLAKGVTNNGLYLLRIGLYHGRGFHVAY